MSTRAHTLPKLLHTILESFTELCGCDGGSIYTLRKDIYGQQTLAFEALITRSIKIQQVPDHLKNLSFKFDESSLVGKTATQRQCFKVSVAEQGREVSKKVDTLLQYATRNILSAPLITPRGDLVGVVQLLNKNPHKGNPDPDFDDRDERLFSIVAGQAALAIENSMLLEEQERLLEGFVAACVTAVESRDPITSGHSTRVSDLTVGLTEAVNRTQTGPLKDVRFSDPQIREIRFAAMLHDIGKISVKESIMMKEKKLMPWELEMIRMRLKLMRANLKMRAQSLSSQNLGKVKEQFEKIELAWNVISEANEPTVLPTNVSELIQDLQRFEVMTEDGERLLAITPEEGFKLSIRKGSLTSEERVEIERHVTKTYEILKMVPWSRGLEAVPEIAFRHHEKLDGSGYPCKSQESQIPVQSRMLTICDIYDALSADDRPYKRAVPVEKALGILEDEVRMLKLDGHLLKIFIEARIYELGPAYKRELEKRKKAA